MKKSLLSRLLKIVLLVGSLSAVSWFIVKNANEIGSYDYTFSWNLLALAALFAVAGHLVNFLVWFKLSSGFGIHTSLLEAGRAWFLSKLGRYIPGKLPFLLFRLNVYGAFPKKTVALATAVEYVSSIAAAAFVVLIGIVSAPDLIPEKMKWIAIGCAILIPVFLRPKFLIPCYNFILKVFKKSPVSGFPPYPLIIKSVSGHVAASFIHGFGFFLLLSSLHNLPIHFFPTVAGIYFAAGLVGLAAVFAPGGIGVLEGFMLLILPSIVPEPVAIVGVIGIRIVVTVTELILAGIFVGLSYTSKRKL